jgi:porin-like protein
MRTSTLITTAVLATLPAAAFAQTMTMTSAVTLGFASSTIDVGGGDIDVNTMSLDFESDTMFGPNFNLGLDFGITQSDFDVGPFDIQVDLMSLAIEPSYRFVGGAYVGVYYRMGDLDVSFPFIPITFGVDTRNYGIFGGYEAGPLWVEGFVGTSDLDPSLPGIDIMDYGLAGSYDVAPNLEVFGSVTRTDIDLGGGFDIDLTNVSLGAEYGFGNGLAVYGSVGRTDIGTPLPISIDGTDFTLGLAYDLGQGGSGVPVNLNLELSRSSFDFGPGASIDIDRIGLGITIPLGGGSSDPLNSRTSAARGDYRSVIGQLVGTF